MDEGNSLVSQERICREYAEKEGYEIAEIFIERGESAKTADRKQLQQMLAFCENRKNGICSVIAYKVDRISRNIADYSHIKLRLKKRGVQIRSVTEYFEDNPAGRFMENIIANVSQFDNEVRAERSAMGMRDAVVLEGRYVWKAPLGFDNVRIMGKTNIAPNGYAPLILETFEIISQRLFATDVVRLLMAEKGLLDKNGKPIARSYFFRLLRNPLYKGIIKKYGMLKAGSFERIVPPHLFEHVQDVLKGRKNAVRHYMKENPDFPLRRFVTDRNGKMLVGYWSKGKAKRYPYYSFGLPKTTIRKERLEDMFLDLLKSLAFDTAKLNIMKDALKNHFEKSERNSELAKVAAKKRLDELNGQIDKLLGLLGQTSIKEETITSRIQSLENELYELNGVALANSNEISIGELIKDTVEILKYPDVFWKSSPLDIKQLFQVFVFPNGIILENEILRTPKIASVFNLKPVLDAQKFPRVTLRDVGKNTLSTDTFTLLEEKHFEEAKLWESVRTDLIKLRSMNMRRLFSIPNK